MGSKKIPGTSYRQRQIERYLVVGHIRPGSLKHCKCRMTLIQMTDLRMQIQSIQKPPSSHSQDQLLLQTQLRAAAIEFARDAAVRRDIRGIVGVQQVQFRPADLDLPGADPQFGAGKIQRSEEHTSELQSRQYLVCRLLLEKKKNELMLMLTHVA